MKKIIICLISLNILTSEDNSFVSIYAAWAQKRDKPYTALDHSWCFSGIIPQTARNFSTSNVLSDDATARMIQIEETIKRTAVSVAESITE